jgi:hypothetical protein
MDREVTRLLTEGQAAAKRGDKAMARALLTQLVEKEPRHEEAWMWLSGVVTDPFEQQICLENALVINPENAQARKGLAYLAARAGTPAPTFESPDVPSTNGTAHAPAAAEQELHASGNGAAPVVGSPFGDSTPFGEPALPADGLPPWAVGDPEFTPEAAQAPATEQPAPEAPPAQAPEYAAPLPEPLPILPPTAAPVPAPEPMSMEAAEMGLPADAQPFVVPGAGGGSPGIDSDIPDWLGNLTPTVQMTEEPQYPQTYAPFNTADFAMPGPNPAPPTTMVGDLHDGMAGSTAHFTESGLHHTDPTLAGQAAPQGQYFDAGAPDLGPMGPYTELQMPTPDELPGGGGTTHDPDMHGSAPSEQPWYLRSSTGNMPPMPDADPMSSSRLGQTVADEPGAKRTGTMVECPNCRESVPDTSLACPSCRYSFFVNCPFCHELVDTSDAKPGVMEPCPYCQNEISKMDMGLGTVNESASQKVPGSRPGVAHTDPKYAFPSMGQQLVEGPVIERRPAIAWVVDLMWLVAIIVMVWALTQLPTWLNLSGQY